MLTLAQLCPIITFYTVTYCINTFNFVSIYFKSNLFTFSVGFFFFFLPFVNYLYVLTCVQVEHIAKSCRDHLRKSVKLDVVCASALRRQSGYSSDPTLSLSIQSFVSR